MRSFLIPVAVASTLVGVGGTLSRARLALPTVPASAGVAEPAVRVEPQRAASSPVGGGGVRAEGPAARVESALAALAGRVRTLSHPEALRRAFQAYYGYAAAHPEQVRKPYLYFVDYGLDSRTPRGYVFDMRALTVVDGPFTVAHGRGSSAARAGVPMRFSNRNGSAATSLGLFLAQETYAFSGTAGGQRYRSLGLRLRGLSGRFNSAARTRGVVVHGAPYVTRLLAGRSEGCPAMEQSRAQRLLPRLANGGLVFLFSPHDESWLRDDPWSQDSYLRQLLDRAR